MQLSWKPGYSLSRKPVKRSKIRRSSPSALENASGQQQFEFIAEHPTTNDRPESSSITGNPALIEAPPRSTLSFPVVEDHLSLSPVSDAEHRAVPIRAQFQNQATTVAEYANGTAPRASSDPIKPIDSTSIQSDESSVSEIDHSQTNIQLPCLLDKIQHASSPSPGSIVESLSSPSAIRDISFGNVCRHLGPPNVAYSSPDLTLEQLTASHYISSPIPPSVLYNSISERFKPILHRYNVEFCKIPLTTDLQINPFLYRADLQSEPIFLVHAAMALVGHHVESSSMHHHRLAALQLLRESLARHSQSEDGFSMLDTIIMLFSLDETQSLLGNWSVHLKGAYSLLEACGGIEHWIKSARAKAQVGILTWWDAITSLLSREEPVFPYAYFEAVLLHHHHREWDFFGLCGCPTSLVRIVMRLARLSAEQQRLRSMRSAAIDAAAVLELEQSLECWRYVSPAVAFRDEEGMQQDQDRMHCSEAWRHGLLLYMYRIFHWEPGQSVPVYVLGRARTILDHVVACREESMVSRQALLPLFFAGCELRDRSSRKKVKEFCSIWNDRTRYYMFGATIPLLEEVWAAQDTRGFENAWWGDVVDLQHMAEPQNPLQPRICFG